MSALKVKIGQPVERVVEYSITLTVSLTESQVREFGARNDLALEVSTRLQNELVDTSDIYDLTEDVLGGAHL